MVPTGPRGSLAGNSVLVFPLVCECVGSDQRSAGKCYEAQQGKVATVLCALFLVPQPGLLSASLQHEGLGGSTSHSPCGHLRYHLLLPGLWREFPLKRYLSPDFLKTKKEKNKGFRNVTPSLLTCRFYQDRHCAVSPLLITIGPSDGQPQTPVKGVTMQPCMPVLFPASLLLTWAPGLLPLQSCQQVLPPSPHGLPSPAHAFLPRCPPIPPAGPERPGASRSSSAFLSRVLGCSLVDIVDELFELDRDLSR